MDIIGRYLRYLRVFAYPAAVDLRSAATFKELELVGDYTGTTGTIVAVAHGTHCTCTLRPATFRIYLDSRFDSCIDLPYVVI